MIYTDKELKSRTFTSNDVSRMLNIPSGSLTTLKNKLKLNVSWVKTQTGRQCVWTYEQYAIIRDYKNRQDAKRKAKIIDNSLPAKKIEQNLSLDELHKLYPLVTDDRFFKLSYFPDVVPECFKESSTF